jgi:hypothetical protein
MQVSGLVVVELGMDGGYRHYSFEPGDFCITPAGMVAVAARWQGERRLAIAEISPSLVQSVAESQNLQSYELLPRHAVRDPQISHLLLALREELMSSGCGTWPQSLV